MVWYGNGSFGRAKSFRLLIGLLNVPRKKRPEKANQNIILHQDNVHPHIAAKTQFEIGVIGFKQFTHAPYFPDIELMDFAGFPYVKSELNGMKYSNDEQLKRVTMKIVRKLDGRLCQSVLDKCVQGHQKCLTWKEFTLEKKNCSGRGYVSQQELVVKTYL